MKIIKTIEEAEKIEKRLTDIIINILLITQKSRLSKEMYEVVSSLQDLRDEI